MTKQAQKPVRHNIDDLIDRVFDTRDWNPLQSLEKRADPTTTKWERQVRQPWTKQNNCSFTDVLVNDWTHERSEWVKAWTDILIIMTFT
jgi:hypothetical protein